MAAPFKEVIAEIKAAGGGVARLCYQCGKCDVVCPWNRVRDFSIRKLIREASLGLTAIEEEEIWRCTTCGTCPAACPRGVEQIELGVALRRVASSYEVFPASARAARTARGSLQSDGNPLGEPREKRADWSRELELPTFAEGMELLYFVGCYYAYDPRLRKVAHATARVLKQAGVSFGVLGTKESCCGESIRKTGAEAVFKALARENIKTFVDHGVRRILVASPHCYHTFKHEYPELMVRFEVVHLSQLLRELLATGRLRPARRLEGAVSYHDPCYLGRHNGIFEEPREVLERLGLTLVELPDARHESLCCGGGGGRIWMETPKGERFADLRIAQARAVGAPRLATACPYCITMLEDARLSLADEEALQVRDLVELVAEAL